MSPLVEVLDVSLSDFDSEQLWGRSIDKPQAGEASESNIYGLEIEGWALGRRLPVVNLEVVHDGKCLWQVAPGADASAKRPDIAAAYPRVPEAESSGFHAWVSSLTLTPEFELVIRAVLQDEDRIELGRIRGRRAPLRSQFKPRLRPLIVTTPGRTGSTVFMRLLEIHPELVVYRPWEYDPRTATYWMEILRALSEPASYLRQINRARYNPDRTPEWFLGTHMPIPQRILDQDIHEWLGVDGVEALAAFCQSRIEALYERIAHRAGRTQASYFVERCPPRSPVPSLIWEIYPEAREVMLVRDFRDIVCSMLAFDAKRGFHGFGRQYAASDEEFVLNQMQRMAQATVSNWERRSDRAHLVRYEDLVLRPTETLETLLNYLGVDASEAIIEKMKSALAERLPAVEAHTTTSSQTASIGRWRHDLRPRLQQACETAFGPALEVFGYEIGSPAAG